MRALQPLTLILPAAHPPKLIEVLWIAACAAVRATVGKLLTLIYPDGSKRPAVVVQAVDNAATMPLELRPSFSAPTRSLKVMAHVDAPPGSLAYRAARTQGPFHPPLAAVWRLNRFSRPPAPMACVERYTDMTALQCSTTGIVRTGLALARSKLAQWTRRIHVSGRSAGLQA